MSPAISHNDQARTTEQSYAEIYQITIQSIPIKVQIEL